MNAALCPMDPCGMCMDVVRSCYTTDMRFWSDSNATLPVRWYFCNDDAKDFPHYHRFASGNWAGEKENWQGVGEVLGAPRPWSNGERMPRMLGQHNCGEEKLYLEGGKYDGVNHTPRAVDGVPTCCAPPVQGCFGFLWPETFALRLTPIFWPPLSSPMTIVVNWTGFNWHAHFTTDNGDDCDFNMACDVPDLGGPRYFVSITVNTFPAWSVSGHPHCVELPGSVTLADVIPFFSVDAEFMYL